MKKLLLPFAIIPATLLSQQIDTTLAFGPDTVMYTLDGKASGIDAYYMNTAVQYTGYAQYYDAPQELSVSGFCFYAWVEDTGMTADVICSMHEPLADSLPGVIIATDTVTVDDTFSFGDIELIRYCATFDAPVIRSQPFVLSVQTNSALDLNIISNDAANNDGAGEALAFYYWSGANPGWTHNEEFFSWDVDWVLCPIVDFNFDVQSTFDQDTICQDDTINVTANMPPIWSHRMYNKRAFDNVEWMDVSWLISQNPPFLGYNVSAPVLQYGDIPINMFVEYNGWRNTTMFPLSANIYADPQPVAGFDHNANQLQVMFSDTSLFADSVHWDFGDSSPISNAQNPTYNYSMQGNYTVQQIAFNDCGSDTTTVDIQLMTTGVALIDEAFVRIYPNPARSFFTLELAKPLGPTTIELVDISGRIVQQEPVIGTKSIVFLDDHVQNGSYQVRVVSEEGMQVMPLLIVR